MAKKSPSTSKAAKKVRQPKSTPPHSGDLLELGEAQIRAGNTKAALKTLRTLSLENKRLLTQNKRVLKKTADTRSAAEREKGFTEALIQNNPVAIVSIDHQSRIMAWNPMAEKLFGYTVAEALGKNIDDLVAKDRHMRKEAVTFSDQAARKESFQALTKRNRKDGSLVDVEVLGLPMLLEDKRVGTIVIYHDITDLQRARREAEEARDAAQREKEFSQALVQNSPAAVVFIDTQSIILAWNPAAEKLFGYTETEALGHNVDKLVASIDQVHSQAVDISQQSSSGEILRIITQRTRKDKSLVDVELLALPMFVNGRVIGTIGIYHDITELQRARQDAERSRDEAQRGKEFFEVLVQNNPVAVVTIDNDANITAWNPAAEKLFGYTRKEALGRNVDELVASHPELLTQAIAYSKTGLELDTDAFQAIAKRTRKDGMLVDVELSGVPIIVQNKKLGMYALYHDITELQRSRREAELSRDAAQREKEYSEALVQNSPAAIVTVDLDAKVMAWNPAAERLFGYSEAEAMGQNVDDLVANTSELHEEAISNNEQSHTQSLRSITKRTRKDGSLVAVELLALPLLVGNQVLGTIAIYHDITELEQTRQQAEQARAAAESANSAKSAFLSTMSHELRTPLNAILGFTRIVRKKAEGVLADKQVENLDKVLVSAEHLLGLINTVLDIAKIEAGRMDVHASNFVINGLIEQCLNLATPLVKANVSLEKNLGPDALSVFSDQDKIKQILLNLLSNAAKFTHEGSIRVELRHGKSALLVDVTDSGIGMNEEALGRIFEEFQQADSTTTRQYGGTGLGLAISRNLAQLLGGDLTATSQPGIGSTFTLELPIQYVEKNTAETLERSTTKAAHENAPDETRIPKVDSTKKLVLVIDDDPDAVYLLQENLNQNEFEVVGARDGILGHQRARELKPHTILLDVMMPGKDGWQVLHDLKADPLTAEIPVILLTIVDKKALGFKLGASAYLLKPLNPAEVLGALKHVTRRETRLHVLVVDDDPNVADMMRQILPESDFHLESATDGLAGLAAIEANPPDVVLLDIMMPRLNGFGVIERLRANPATRELPIIVISAKELSDEEARKLEESVAFVMKKQGFDGDKLVREINASLQK